MESRHDDRKRPRLVRPQATGDNRYQLHTHHTAVSTPSTDLPEVPSPYVDHEVFFTVPTDMEEAKAQEEHLSSEILRIQSQLKLRVSTQFPSIDHYIVWKRLAQKAVAHRRNVRNQLLTWMQEEKERLRTKPILEVALNAIKSGMAFSVSFEEPASLDECETKIAILQSEISSLLTRLNLLAKAERKAVLSELEPKQAAAAFLKVWLKQQRRKAYDELGARRVAALQTLDPDDPISLLIHLQRLIGRACKTTGHILNEEEQPVMNLLKEKLRKAGYSD